MNLPSQVIPRELACVRGTTSLRHFHDIISTKLVCRIPSCSPCFGGTDSGGVLKTPRVTTGTRITIRSRSLTQISIKNDGFSNVVTVVVQSKLPKRLGLRLKPFCVIFAFCIELRVFFCNFVHHPNPTGVKILLARVSRVLTEPQKPQTAKLQPVGT